jgi:hypothetical protein
MDCQKGKDEAATWHNGNQSNTAIFRIRTESGDFFWFPGQLFQNQNRP